MSEDRIFTQPSSGDVSGFMEDTTIPEDLRGRELPKELKSLYDNSSEDPIAYTKNLYQQLKEKDPSVKCLRCKDNNTSSIPCPVCGKSAASLIAGKVVDVPSELSNKVFIPDKFKTAIFDPSKLRDFYPDLKESGRFRSHVNLLSSLAADFASGKLPQMSLYISAPTGFAKSIFAYYCLMIGLSKNLKVFPYLDLMEVRNLIDACETSNKRDRYVRQVIEDVGFTDIDLYNADVCILKVPHGNEMHGAYKTMLQVIDRRARRGKSTIILSRYRFDLFCNSDMNKEAMGLISYSNPSPKDLQVYEILYRRKDFDYVAPEFEGVTENKPKSIHDIV